MTRRFLTLVALCLCLVALGATSARPGMSDGLGGPGIPAGFGVQFVLVLLGGGAITLRKISTAHQLAQESGLDPDRAAAMVLLTDDGQRRQPGRACLRSCLRS